MFKKIFISAFIIVAAAFLFMCYGRKNLHISKETIKATYSLPNSHFIKWNNGEIHYTESGKGFPILMIHGFGGSNYDFQQLDSLLNDQYRIIRIDLPGFGMSDFPNQLLKEKNYT
ncbi:MAG TPA: alpha/beta fold hydrolase, partial [Chitinophagales bacterium]|nr:alpha/beta fold hydrolase [Chitinophagales bacterium]